MINLNISDLHLIVGGEVQTKSGPRPLSTQQVIATTANRLERAKLLAHLGLRRYDCQLQRKMVALERLGLIFEMVVLQWLTSQGFQFAPHRSLIFKRLIDGEMISETRELDGVVLDARNQVKTIVEVKLSTQGMHAVGTKRTQLNETLQITRTRWPKAKGLIVFIRVGNRVLPEERLVRTQPGWLFEKHRFCLENLPAAWQKTNTPMIVIPFNVIWDYADANGWKLNPELRSLANQYALERFMRRQTHYERRVLELNHVELGESTAHRDAIND